jgi:hypothetical protein
MLQAGDELFVLAEDQGAMNDLRQLINNAS